jgi:outer membrane protein OmpA-like peptidoglycan-associated protein
MRLNITFLEVLTTFIEGLITFISPCVLPMIPVYVLYFAGASEGRFEDLYTKCTDVNFTPVYFGFDSTVVPQGELGKIDAVVQHLTEKRDRVVVVEGHCDERGSNEYNLPLGENRAIIIRNYLVQGGISADRIQTRSYGEEKPAVDGHDESAWSKNRRGEFGIFKK